MTDYIPPDPAVAERVYKQRQAEKALGQRLRDNSPEQLKRLARLRNAEGICSMGIGKVRR